MPPAEVRFEGLKVVMDKFGLCYVDPINHKHWGTLVVACWEYGKGSNTDQPGKFLVNDEPGYFVSGQTVKWRDRGDAVFVMAKEMHGKYFLIFISVEHLKKAATSKALAHDDSEYFKAIEFTHENLAAMGPMVKNQPGFQNLASWTKYMARSPFFTKLRIKTPAELTKYTKLPFADKVDLVFTAAMVQSGKAGRGDHAPSDLVGASTACEENKTALLEFKGELLKTAAVYDAPFEHRFIHVVDFEEETLEKLLDQHGDGLQNCR